MPDTTTAIIQARMSSTRLPGKVLMSLHGMPMLAFMIERVKMCQTVSSIVIATSADPSDDPLVHLARSIGVSVVRGSLHDVLDRFASAAALFPSDVYLRLTGDCPLIDAALVDRIAAPVIAGEADYASNVAPPTFPDGLDCEAFTSGLLSRAVREAELASDREHVTPFMRRCLQVRKQNVQSAVDLSAVRWTVDYTEDFDRIAEMVKLVGSDPVGADQFDYLRAYSRLALDVALTSNSRNEGYAASLAADRAPLKE